MIDDDSRNLIKLKADFEGLEKRVLKIEDTLSPIKIFQDKFRFLIAVFMKIPFMAVFASSLYGLYQIIKKFFEGGL